MTRHAALLLMMLGSVAAGLPVIGVKLAKHYIWNASESVPVGLYRLQSTGKLGVSDLVAVEPPEPLATFLSDGGYLPRGVPMLKRILALPGQKVCRHALTIAVDDIMVGEARQRDSRGRLLPVWHGCRVVLEDELFLMNLRSADSLDGRYLGPLPASAVIGLAQPIWINETAAKE